MRKSSLTTAVVAGLSGLAGLAGLANAVNVNPDGLGQVLIYPYYTANANNETLISVVNTTNETKAVKVRFLEALNSAEVLDFNLYLSPFDVWVGSVSGHDLPRPDATASGGANGGAYLFTNDTSCTVPNAVGKDNTFNAAGELTAVGRSSGFVPFEYKRTLNGLNGDRIGVSNLISLGGVPGNEFTITNAERLRQGYVEIIEMGVVLNEAAPSTFRPAAWAKHQAETGAPLNCALLERAWSVVSGVSGGWLNTADVGQRSVNTPSGGLFGGGVIVDIPTGRALSYNAEAIDGFYSATGLAANADGTTRDLHFAPGNVQPNLGQARTGASEATARVFVNGDVVSATFNPVAGAPTEGARAVTAALSTRFIFNEFNLEPVLNAASEWVVTFPTKRLHLQAAAGAALTTGDTRPFTDNREVEAAASRNDNGPFDTYGSCEAYSFDRWDREELPTVAGSQPPIISPPPPDGADPDVPLLCWEANVIAFEQAVSDTTASRVLGVTAKQGAHGLTGLFTGVNNGWARIEFAHPNDAGTLFRNHLISQSGSDSRGNTGPIAFIGLPAVGFWAADYAGLGTVGNLTANFSQIHKHRSSRGYVVNATNPGAPTSTPNPLNATTGTFSTGASPVGG